MSRLAILIAEPIRGVALESAVNVTAGIVKGEIGPGGVHVVLGLPFEAYADDTLRAVREKTGAELRDFGIELTDRKFLRGFFDWRDDERSSLYPQTRFARPRDKVSGFDFLDCDRWLFWNLPAAAPVAGLRPYAAGLHLAFQRGRRPDDQAMKSNAVAPSFQAPDDISKLARAYSLRGALACFSSSRHVAEEVTSIYGARRANVFVLSPMLDGGDSLRAIAIHAQARPYILVPTDISAMHSIDRVVETLERYYFGHGGGLDFVFAGEGARLLRPPRAEDSPQMLSWEVPHGEADAFRKRVGVWSRRFQNRLAFYNRLDDDMMRGLVTNATAVWLPQLWSDRDFVSLEAARAGVHVIGARLPSLEELVRDFGAKASLHDIFSPAAAANALMAVEVQARVGGAAAGWTTALAVGAAAAAKNAGTAMLERLLA